MAHEKPVVWENAPSWANYFAVDNSGVSHWFEDMPRCGSVRWITLSGRSNIANAFATESAKAYWAKSLQVRPTEEIGKARQDTAERLGKAMAEKKWADWDKAPTWANYLALDSDGYGRYYEKAPNWGSHRWYAGDGRCTTPVKYVSGCGAWRESLEVRPVAEPETTDIDPETEELLMAAIRVLSAKAIQAEEALKKEQEANRELQGKYERLQSVHSAARGTQKLAESLLQKQGEEMRAWREEAVTLHKEINVAINQHLEDQKTIQHLQAKLATIEGIETWRIDRIKTLERRLSEAKADTFSVKERASNIADTIPDLESRLVTSRAVVDALNLTILTLQQNLRGATNRADDADASAATHRATIEAQDTRIAELEKDAKDRKAHITALLLRISTLQRTLRLAEEREKAISALVPEAEAAHIARIKHTLDNEES